MEQISPRYGLLTGERAACMSQETLYTLAFIGLVFNAIVAVGITAFVWRRRDAPAAREFCWVALVGLGWTLVAILSAVSPSAELAEFWSVRAKYIFAALSSVTIMVFVLTYTGRSRWLTRGRLALLLVVPALTQLANWFWPAIFITHSRFERYKGPFFFLVDDDTHWWFWVYMVYSTGLLLISLGLIAWHAYRSQSFYRRQALMLLLGFIPPLLVATMSSIGVDVGLLKQLPPEGTLLSMIITVPLWAWALFRYRLFDIMPLARGKVIERMDDAVVVLDRWERIADLNPSAAALLGAAAPGQDARPFLTSHPTLVEALADAATTRAEVTMGEGPAQRTLELQVTPLYHDQGGPAVGRLLVLHDISERKRAEEERERLIAELDAYAHTVAHDLKSPLTVLIGFSTLLHGRHRQMAPAKVDENLLMIRQTGDKMANIINELLLLASVRGMEQVAAEPLDMAAIAAEAQERLGPMIAEYGATVVAPAAWPEAVGHAPWVEEVWVNYLSNALKYGGRPPYVELGAAAQDNGQVRFWVRDNGPGLDAGQQAQLFTQFTRLHKMRATGHGLGLSIVQRIVQRLGGNVGVESQEGVGSLFYFTLPAANPADG